MPAPVELVADARCAVGESPVWIASEQALYWVDIPAPRLHRWRAAGGTLSTWTAPEMIGCIAPSTRGGFIAAMQTGIFHLVPQDGGTLDCARLSEVAHAARDMRFNDGRCDRQGRFWAGTMGIDMTLAASVGSLYRFDDRRGLARTFGGFVVPNGLAFSPDGRTMYLSDSHPSVQLIWQFDYDVDSATPANRRLYVDMNTLPGRPDGAAIDEDGCYWTCANDAGLVHRLTPGGKLDRSLPVPVKKPSMCAFGGDDLDTLFVTSIRPGEVDLADQPLAGGVFALRPGVRGVEEPHFGNHQLLHPACK